MTDLGELSNCQINIGSTTYICRNTNCQHFKWFNEFAIWHNYKHTCPLCGGRLEEKEDA